MEQIILLLITYITYIAILSGIVHGATKWLKASGKYKNALIIALLSAIMHTAIYLLPFYFVSNITIKLIDLALFLIFFYFLDKYYPLKFLKILGIFFLIKLSSLILTEMLIIPILTKI